MSNGHPLQCPSCASAWLRTSDSRPTAHGFRRRRVCNQCGTRFTTYETAGKATWEAEKAAAAAKLARRYALAQRALAGDLDDLAEDAS